MSGSRLGRGRGGRLAVYGCCGVVVVLLVFLYRAATSEMARLRELHVQCAHQQEALAAQLQVIFEYKVRLEKSLAEEKSSNAAVKQELQQRASREKSLRDKDSLEAMQRFNSLQQTYKLLQTEHQDLQDECKKREKQALDDMSRLETTLQDLRSKIRHAREEKEQSMNHLKNKYLELETEKTKLEEKYNEMLEASGNTNSTIDHLKKEVFQLKRELEQAKKSPSKSTSPLPSAVSPQSSQQVEQPALRNAQGPSNEKNVGQQPQQVSPPNNEELRAPPLGAPRDHHGVGDPLSNEALKDDGQDNVGFAQNGLNVVPIGLNEQRDQQEQKNSLPLPYNFQENQKKMEKQDAVKKDKGDSLNANGEGRDEEEERKQVAPPPNSEPEKGDDKESVRARVEEGGPEDELQKLQSQSTAAPSTSKSTPVKSESSTKSLNNPASTTSDKALSQKKSKLPVGVVPIPKMMAKQDEEFEKREPIQHHPQKNIVNGDGKDNEQEADGNLDPPIPVGRHVGDQILERWGNPGWLGPGVQEIGDVLHQMGRMDDGGDRQADGGDENYDDPEYEKDLQKNSNPNLGGAEDEAEDEEDYVQNIKPEKRE